MGLVQTVRRRTRRLSLRNAVVVAGLGRCGTTLVFDSVADYGYKRAPGFLTSFDGAPEFKAGVVYKTHAYPPLNLAPQLELLFLFGDPMNSALSAHRKINAWGRDHHEHCGSNLFQPDDGVIAADTLQLFRLFKAWYRPQAFSFCSVRYEQLYDPEVRRGIDRYLGFGLKLPPYRDRTTDWRQHPRKERLEEVYGELAALIEEAEPFKVWTARIESTNSTG